MTLNNHSILHNQLSVSHICQLLIVSNDNERLAKFISQIKNK